MEGPTIPDTTPDTAHPVIDTRALLEGNAKHVEQFDVGELVVRPRKRLSVLTCMDSRYTSQGILGLALGDAHIIRNAGGRVTDDAIRSLVLSAHLLGTRGCLVIHHADCGLFEVSNEAIHDRIREATGSDASSIDFLPFTDLEASVREDVAQLRASALFPADYEVQGFTYDVRTGRLAPVEG